MDYVVAGFGIGAILALGGFALWELFGNVEEPGQTWLSRVAIGLMIGALVIWSVTGVSLISTVDDSTGSRLVLLTTLVTLVAIGVGSYWYWRADRTIAAYATTVTQDRKHEATVAAAPMNDDVELSEWDSWPERGKTTKDEAPAGALALVPVNFEPEVAVVAVVVATEADAVEAGDDLQPEASEAAEDVDEGGEVVEEVVEAEPAEIVADEEPELPESQDEPSPELPSMQELSVRDEDVLPAVDEEQEVAEEPTLAAELEDESEPNDEETDKPLLADGGGGPAVFESALLADIDSDSIEGNGRYRSPLLSDLEADQLEGVGLARWRADSRLTAAETNDSPKNRTP